MAVPVRHRRSRERAPFFLERPNEIELIDPRDYKKYFDWGEVVERIMGVALAKR